MTSAAHRTMTASEYLAWEREQPDRHEFHRGEVFAMAGGSPRHNALCAAVVGDLRLALRGGVCRVLTSDQRVSLAHGDRYVYPDATVVCGPVALEEGTRDVITNPTIVVEVLSAATEAYDRGAKWEAYRQLTSLEDYVLVSQRAEAVEHFQRCEDGSWRYTALRHGEHIALKNGLRISVSELYEGTFDLPGDDEVPAPSRP